MAVLQCFSPRAENSFLLILWLSCPVSGMLSVLLIVVNIGSLFLNFCILIFEAFSGADRISRSACVGAVNRKSSLSTFNLATPFLDVVQNIDRSASTFCQPQFPSQKISPSIPLRVCRRVAWHSSSKFAHLSWWLIDSSPPWAVVASSPWTADRLENL